MTYELAKQLKDADFPHEMQWVRKVPTLSELIEACGHGLQSLINNFYNEEKGWIAFTNTKNQLGERMEIWGETPEEAVAKLWLELKKKQ